jgi:hypothetical protein
LRAFSRSCRMPMMVTASSVLTPGTVYGTDVALVGDLEV